MLEDHRLASRLIVEDYVMTKVLFMELSIDWSYDEFSILLACLEEEDHHEDIHVYLQDIIYWSCES
jgi:hypothetical protein